MIPCYLIFFFLDIGIKDEPVSETSDLGSELSRFKNVLISETDDFGPMGGRFQLQTEDQHPETSGMIIKLLKRLFLFLEKDFTN